MHASMGQYSMHAGEPAQPVQQSVVIASMRGFFLRVALPSPTDIGSCFSTMSKMLVSASAVMCETLTYRQVSLNDNSKRRKQFMRSKLSGSITIASYDALVMFDFYDVHRSRGTVCASVSP